MLAALVLIAAVTQQPGYDEDLIQELGHKLFFEKEMSGDGSTSCADCHKPHLAYTDGRRLAIGRIGGFDAINGQIVRRHPNGTIGNVNTPTVLYAGHQREQFHNGRSISLNDQALQPLTNQAEMGNNSVQDVMNRLARLESQNPNTPNYRVLYAKAFGSFGITPQRTAYALMRWQSTLNGYNAPIDRYLRGEKDALSPVAKEGWELFTSRGCIVCHPMPHLRDGRYHNVGIALRSNSQAPDRANVTGRGEDIRAYKTPTLRELNLTGPYMHNGSLPTIEDAVHHFNAGGYFLNGAGQAVKDARTSPLVRPLGMTRAQVNAIATFLREGTASPDRPEITEPELP